jgi:hypothetical protein
MPWLNNCGGDPRLAIHRTHLFHKEFDPLTLRTCAWLYVRGLGREARRPTKVPRGGLVISTHLRFNSFSSHTGSYGGHLAVLKARPHPHLLHLGFRRPLY